ncbi:MAG: formate dehydrogenase subunit alpha [Chloroflexota bacterium]
MTDVTLSVDGRVIEMPSSATVLDAILRLKIDLPHLCKDPDREPLGTCRTCLVEIRGRDGVQAACTTPVEEGLVVATDSVRAVRIRRGVLGLTLDMLSETNLDLLGELGEAARVHDLAARERGADPAPASLDASNVFWDLDRSRCILCQRCVVACQDVQQTYALTVLDRSADTSIGVFGHGRIADSNCTSCGQCWAACPTQAIQQKTPSRAPIERTVETICPYCGVGCGMSMQLDAFDQLVQVDDVPANPSSLGMLCVKGRFGLEFVRSPDRLTTPLIRRMKHGPFETASWDEALNHVASQLWKHRGRFAALGSAKATNEDGYVLQKLARLVMGTNNVDHCSRLCHAPSVAGLTEMFGSGSTTNSYADFEAAGCLMVVGSDTDSNHPVIAARLRRAVEENGARLIVVNPRRIALCDLADTWLRPRSGTDVALFNGLARIVLDEGLWDRSFVQTRTEGFDLWRESLERYTSESVSEITGIPLDALYAAAREFARPQHGGSCLLWGMGITQHTQGLANVQAMANLALVTGQVGKPGAGLAPLRGQNNVQGCGDAGVLPDTLPGYQGLSTEVRGRFAARWGMHPPEKAGLKLTEMFDAALRGELRALYLVGENPMLTEPNVTHARRGLESLDFLVVQMPFLNETGALADVVLPATTFAEKDGTFTNSERRVQRVRQAIEPVGESQPDWWISCEIARRIEALAGRSSGQFDYQHPSEIFDEMAALVPFLGGISYQPLEHGGIQWPCPTPAHPGTPVLFAESFPRGLGKFVPVQQGPRAQETPDTEYPLVLNTGRVLYHWHGGDLTRRVAGLLTRYPEVELSVHPDDARVAGVTDGDRARIVTRRGVTEAVVLISGGQRSGEVFLPFVSLNGTTANLLTHDAYAPRVGIPEYKACAVRIEKVV